MPDTLTPGLRWSVGSIKPLSNALLLASSRALGVIAQMGVQVAVGALAGPGGIGTLQLHASWSSLLGEVLGRGEPTRALKDTAISPTRHSICVGLQRAFRSTLRASLYMALGVATLVGIALLSGESWTSKSPAPGLIGAILIAAPIFAGLRVLAETLKGLGQTVAAVTLENSGAPLVLLLFCALAWGNQWSVSSDALLIAACAGLLITGLALAHKLYRQLPEGEASAPAASEASSDEEHREQLHFWCNSLLNIAFLQLPFLLMPWFLQSDAVGHYAVAHKLVNVITTLLILQAAVFGPRFARAAKNQRRRARRELRLTQLISLGVFLPSWIATLLLAPILASLFSVDGDILFRLLLILGLGQLVNALTGLAGVFLNMTGAAHFEAPVLLCSMLTTAGLALLLAGEHGALGVAIAVSVGLALRNGAAYGLALFHLRQLEQSSP